MRVSKGVSALVVVLCFAPACTGGDGTTAPPDGTSQPRRGAYEATIRRTTDGVPHISAADPASLSFGQGYASGEDRVCDLADQVVKIRSERSRWLGTGDDNANLESDFAWKSIGIYERAVAEYPDKSASIHEVFDGFAAGWNTYLADTGVDGLPFWCAGQAWVQPVSAEDVYAYARSVALQASGTRLTEFIAGAQPPDATASAPTTESALGPATSDDAPMASNGWAIGAERSTDGGGLLLANPHFPWEGELRFWEVQLTISDQMDIYGVQLSGLPGIAIGFTDEFAWTHTVSAGNRFTAYTLDLVPGTPTSYLYDGQPRPMESRTFEIEVLQPDGTATTQSKTMWFTHYGPVVDFTGDGWTTSAATTYRDANIDNDEFTDQYLAMNQAASFDEFVAAHETHQGVPLFNTVAVSKDGRAWYADTSATPNLSPRAIDQYLASIASDPIVSVAAQSGAVFLDGSNSVNEWVDEPGARDPGLVPYARMPQVQRADYVFNANDSFWLPNAEHVLEGDYSVLHGRQQTARSPRTRENALILRDTSTAGPSGGDGRFDLDELSDATLQNRGYTSTALLADVVSGCRELGPVRLAPLMSAGGQEVLPPGTVDLTGACDVLSQWDGRYDLDSVGPALWREFISRWESPQLRESGTLWALPFDPARPVDTPSGLADGAADAVWVTNLARAIQIMGRAGQPIDAALGDLQAADRNGTRVPIHGGTNFDGTINIVDYGQGQSTLEPVLTRGPTFAPRSGLTADGYLVNNGSSFVMTVHFGPDGPEARVFLTYGNTADRDDPLFVEATREFSSKDWRTVAFKNQAIASDRNLEETTVSG